MSRRRKHPHSPQGVRDQGESSASLIGEQPPSTAAVTAVNASPEGDPIPAVVGGANPVFELPLAHRSDSLASGPRVAVIVVTYNSQNHLQDLFSSLRAQSHAQFQLIVVDSNSNDNTRVWVRQHWPEAKLIAADTNLGYRQGNQLGMEIAAASSDRRLDTPNYLLILNDDVELHPAAIERMLAAAEANPRIAIVAPAILQHGYSSRINAAGSSLLPSGFYSARGKGRDYREFGDPADVAAASGCCFLYRTSVYCELGGFDNLFDTLPGSWHASAEDLDLCWRAWRGGYRVFYEPGAILWHKYRQRPLHASRFASLVTGRLAFLTLNFPDGALLRLAPMLLLTDLALAAFSLLRGRAFLRGWMAGYRWLWGSRRRLKELRGMRKARSRDREFRPAGLMQSAIRLPPSLEENRFLWAAALLWFCINWLSLGMLAPKVAARAVIPQLGVRG